MNNLKNKKCEAVLKAILDDKNITKSKLPHNICHYSSLFTVFNEIIKKDYTKNDQHYVNLRYNQVEFMNDDTEFKIGRQLFNEITNKDFSPYEQDNVYSLLKQECLIASFTQRIDDLYFWKMYGDDCKGACVVYKGDKMYSEKYIKSIFTHCQYFKINANGDLADNDINKAFISKYKKIYSDTQSFNDSHKTPASILFYVLSIMAKNEDYSYEDEIRLFILPEKTNDKKSYIHTNGKIRYYIDEPNPFDTIDYIVLGPRVSKETYDAFKKTLNDLHINIEIRRSNIHYR